MNQSEIWAESDAVLRRRLCTLEVPSDRDEAREADLIGFELRRRGRATEMDQIRRELARRVGCAS